MLSEKFGRIKNKINTLIQKSALANWPWQYWIFSYGIIPLILVIVPQVPQILQSMGMSPLLTQDFFNLTFLLDVYHPTIVSMFLMNYTHTELIHLCGNLSVYFLVMTIIFVLEYNKRRFFTTSTYFLILLPFIVSIVSILFFRGLPINMVSFKGFSGIIMAYYGYSIYLLLFTAQSGFLARANNDWYDAKWIKKLQILYSIFVFSFILVIAIFLSGIIIGSFFTVEGGALGNGIAHFTGFIFGLLVPIVYGLMSIRKLNFLDISIGFNIFFTLALYSMYLVRIHA
jgi:hypothetical protein